MKKMGFVEFLPESIAGYIITTYLYPKDPNFDFTKFYTILYRKGEYLKNVSKTCCDLCKYI